MSPKYDLDKIKFATDPATFERAVDLYTSGKVTKFKEKEGVNVYSAVVQGGQPYHVSVEARRYGCGHCDCYLGKKSTLCKHIVAVALYAVMDGQPLSDEDKKSVNNPTSSGHLGDLTKEELVTIKKAITYGLRYIKPYNGPSRLWFSYQNSLQEGCGRLAKIVSDLPVNKKTAQILVTLLLRLDEKLTRWEALYNRWWKYLVSMPSSIPVVLKRLKYWPEDQPVLVGKNRWCDSLMKDEQL